MEAFTTKALALRFESLGCDCEFGLVQRSFGAEPLGLVRFTSHDFRCLREALQDRFQGLADGLTLYRNSNGYLVSLDPPRNFHFNTLKRADEVDDGELLTQEKSRWKFLRSKLLGDLSACDKVFVRRAAVGETDDDMMGLHADLRTYGANTLLWVQTPRDGYPSEQVIVERAGLLRGFLDSRPMDTPTFVVNRDPWVRLCRRALRLLESDAHSPDDFDTPPAGPLRIVTATNTSWTGELELGSNGRLRHMQHRTLAGYYQQEDLLHVRWDAYDSQTYFATGGIFHELASKRAS